MLSAVSAHSQATPAPTAPPKRIIVRAGRLIDGVAETARSDQGILVEGDHIVAVGAYSDVSGRASGADRIDLSGMTVLPGLIDNHTHVLLQGDITAADYDEQLLKESIPYRTIRATAAARTALLNGFTTIRDLETEGAMYADVDLKTAIARSVVPGPRMFVATRAFSATGMYPLLGYSWELKMPEGVQVVDGPDEIRKAVREQVKYGADWIKVYADRKYYIAPDGRLRSWVNFTDEEFRAFVAEAHRLGRKVAVHAVGWDGIDAALRAGVNTIEHGDGLTPDLIARMVKQKVYWCPTIYVGVYVASGRGGPWPRMVELERQAFGTALKRGLLPYILRDGCRRLRVDGEPGERVRLHGEVRNDAHAGDQVGNQRGSEAAGSGGQPGDGGRRPLRGYGSGARRPARRYHRAGAGPMGNEGRDGVPVRSMNRMTSLNGTGPAASASKLTSTAASDPRRRPGWPGQPGLPAEARCGPAW